MTGLRWVLAVAGASALPACANSSAVPPTGPALSVSRQVPPRAAAASSPSLPSPPPSSLRSAIEAVLDPSLELDEAATAAGSPTPPGDPEPGLLPPLIRGAPPLSSFVAESPSPLTAARSASLPPQAVQRVVRQNQGRFRACYRRGLQRFAKLQGRVAVRFTIGAEGEVVEVREEPGSLGDRETRACVMRAFFALSFPKLGGRPVVVGYPIMFTLEGSTPPAEVGTPSREHMAGATPPTEFVERFKSGTPVVQPPPPARPPQTPHKARGRAPCEPGDPVCSDL